MLEANRNEDKLETEVETMTEVNKLFKLIIDTCMYMETAQRFQNNLQRHHEKVPSVLFAYHIKASPITEDNQQTHHKRILKCNKKALNTLLARKKTSQCKSCAYDILIG